MKISKQTRWITRTAIFVALTVMAQGFTAPLGNPMITGSIVNMMLITAAVSCGMSSGIVVGLISPVMAKLIGIGPLWALIPFIILGNITIVVIWQLICRKKDCNKAAARFIAVIAGAVGKFAVLYFGIVKIAVPVILQLPDPQAGVVSAMFSFPQLITALIGGVLALTILPVIEKIMNRKAD